MGRGGGYGRRRLRLWEGKKVEVVERGEGGWASVEGEGEGFLRSSEEAGEQGLSKAAGARTVQGHENKDCPTPWARTVQGHRSKDCPTPRAELRAVERDHGLWRTGQYSSLCALSRYI